MRSCVILVFIFQGFISGAVFAMQIVVPVVLTGDTLEGDRGVFCFVVDLRL